MMTQDSFDHRPDPTIRRLLRDHLSVQDHDAFVVRMLEAARRSRRGSQPAVWELLARWHRPGVAAAAAAILAGALVGVGASERGSSIVSLAEALGPAEAPAELLAADTPPDPQVLLSLMPEAPGLTGDPAPPSTREQRSKLVVEAAPLDTGTAHRRVDNGAIVGRDPLDTVPVPGRALVRQPSETPPQVLVPDQDVAVHRPEPGPPTGPVEPESQALLTLPEGTRGPVPLPLRRGSQNQSGHGQCGPIPRGGRAGDKCNTTLP
jgi:hypothetical protein